MNKNFLIIIVICTLFGCTRQTERVVVSLNGEWEAGKIDGSSGLTAAPPSVEYASRAPVPGLVDLAVPALDTAGTLYTDSSRYCFRRTFEIADVSYDVIQLKIFKAKYHTQVWLNERFAGENYYCFTPSYFDLKPFLRKGKNEIVIAIGSKNALPDTIPNGHDNEKIRHIPGIYDNVEITFSGKPFITNVQCAPDIKRGTVRVQAEIDANGEAYSLHYEVVEKASGKRVAQGKSTDADFEILLPEFALWTPDTPFLYELTLTTGADTKRTSFGMRSFSIDVSKGIALLNSKPYYMRGTNVCIYRFFEDPDRATLPWDRDWTLRLHERFKSMNWDMARYCIGFPPEHWYDVCDSLGFMVQDEFPFWDVQKLQPRLKAKHIAEEYRRWLRERWNHPSVIIWDAQNECITKETGEAANMVRALDLSNRPWENGWSEPASETLDLIEAHPYIFLNYMHHGEGEQGYRKEIFDTVRYPWNNPNDRMPKANGAKYPNPLLINEYGWIWLNRDGSPTLLTDGVYENLWQGSKLTPQERLHIYARHLAMLTEYWRAHRQAAGVLHFCGLGYSRPTPPRGHTSDHWLDIANLAFEPEFEKYVRPSFAPVGLMLDVWEKSYKAASTLNVPTFITNDLETPFAKEMTLSILHADKLVSEVKRQVSAKPYEVAVANIEIKLPDEAGEYLLKAEYTNDNDEKIFSLRDLKVQ